MEKFEIEIMREEGCKTLYIPFSVRSLGRNGEEVDGTLIVMYSIESDSAEYEVVWLDSFMKHLDMTYFEKKVIEAYELDDSYIAFEYQTKEAKDEQKKN